MWETSLYNTTKLTLELRDIVDNGENSVDIWNFDYPSFYKGDEKKAFERKVIDHYYFRQIGQETVGRWMHYFRSRIREIMPYYIRMYESVKLMDDLENPFDNVDVVETFEQETQGTGTAETSGSGTSESSGSDTDKTTGTESSSSTNEKTASEDKTHKYSNTPQGEISNIETHMSEASVDENTNSEKVESSGTGNTETNRTGSSTSSSTSSSTGESSTSHNETIRHTLTRKGNQGVNTYAHDIMEYRKSLIDVDMMIINNLQDLFLGVY